MKAEWKMLERSESDVKLILYQTVQIVEILLTACVGREKRERLIVNPVFSMKLRHLIHEITRDVDVEAIEVGHRLYKFGDLFDCGSAPGTVEHRGRNNLEVLEVTQDLEAEQILAIETMIGQSDLDKLESAHLG